MRIVFFYETDYTLYVSMSDLFFERNEIVDQAIIRTKNKHDDFCPHGYS